MAVSQRGGPDRSKEVAVEGGSRAETSCKPETPPYLLPPWGGVPTSTGLQGPAPSPGLKV